MVPGRSHLECNPGEAFMKSKYVEFDEISCNGIYTKNRAIQTGKSIPGRSRLEYHLGKPLMKSKYAELLKFLIREFMPKTESQVGKTLNTIRVRH